jgi:hypothetical protein
MENQLTDVDLRLKCIDYVANRAKWPSYSIVNLMIESEILYRYIKDGKLPYGSPNVDASSFIDLLIEKALEHIKNEPSNSNNAASRRNTDADNIEYPKPLLSKLLSMFRGKESAL